MVGGFLGINHPLGQAEEIEMIAEPRCLARGCKWFLGIRRNDADESTDEFKEWVICEAFLEGIPDEIAFGDNLHDRPFKGDRGTQFEKTGER